MASEGIYYNRLSGKCKSKIDDGPLGIWLLEIEDGKALLNSALVQHFDYLVPDRTGHWRLTSENDGDIDRGKGHGEGVPESLELESVQRLASELTAGDKTPAWLEWLDVSPVAPGLSEEIELKPLDKAIKKYAPFLEAVCHRPKAHLQIEIEKVHTSAARRIPPQAVPYLASHTEDWEQPTLRGIRPKKILSEIRDDQYDIYENRLSINLLNHLSRYLQMRVRELKRVQTTLEEHANHAAKAGGAHQRSERICRLWGQVVNADRAQKRLKETYEIIRSLAYRIDGLMHSPLYQQIPSRARLPDQLKSTNIFVNDFNYHNVSRLWIEWLRHRPKDSAETPLMLYRRLQVFGRSFEEFCLLLVIRALDQLRIEPLDEALSLGFRARGGQVLQLSDNKQLICKWDGTFELCCPRGTLVRIVPLSLVISSSEEASMHSLLRISEEVRSSPHPVLVLHLSGQANDRRRLPPEVSRKLQMAGNEVELALAKKLSVMPVSPWEIDSVERVARALRWWTLGEELSFYPANAGLLPNIIKMPAVSWLRVENGSINVLRNPTTEEVDELALQNKLHEIKLKLAARGTRRNEVEQTVKPAADFVSRFDEFIKQLPIVMRCPVCAYAGARINFRSGAGGYTQFTCPNCSSVWGLRICRDCHGKIPILETGNVLAPDPAIPGSVDSTLGCDVLSIPTHSEHGQKSFLCPRCGSSGK